MQYILNDLSTFSGAAESQAAPLAIDRTRKEILTRLVHSLFGVILIPVRWANRAACKFNIGFT